MAKRPPPRLILDIGGGSERFAVPLHEAGHRLFGADVDATPLRILARDASEVGRVLVSGRIDELPIADDSVDCVPGIDVPVLDDPTSFSHRNGPTDRRSERQRPYHVGHGQHGPH